MDKEDFFCQSLEYMKLIEFSRVEYSKWSKKTKDIRNPGIHTVPASGAG
jgi:hypothetical protein